MFARLKTDKVKVFSQPGQSVQSSLLPMVSDLSYLFSSRLMAPLWEKVQLEHAAVGKMLDIEGVPFYIWENNEKVAIAYGTMVGSTRQQYAISSFPQPKLNATGIESRARRVAPPKTD